MIERTREAASIGGVAAWPDWTNTRILALMNARHLALASDEMIKARAGYGSQKQYFTTTAGLALYPVPDRAIGGVFEKLEIQYPGQTEWTPLTREDITGAEYYEQGPTKPNKPQRYVVQDGFVELMPVPDAAYSMRWTFFIRPSMLVTSQSSTQGGDGVVRGRITIAPNKTTRQITVNALPFDQSLSVPAAITSGNQLIDIVRPNGTFACAMFNVPQTISGLVITLGGTDSMDRIQIGDFVRVADQTDWPSNMPAEFHDILPRRTAMEILQTIGVEEMISVIGAGVQADVDRWRSVRNPQVKSQPKRIPVTWRT
jgi:hypothetical protein